MERRRRVDVVLFDRFELLDAAGPIELLGSLPELFDVRIAGPSRGVVRSTQGAAFAVDEEHREIVRSDLLLVPGGVGTRPLVRDRAFLAWSAGAGAASELVASVCTGSALLAAAGLLDGRRATSNKRELDRARGFGDRVERVPRARRVADGDRWTSSGVAAGMDMTAALIRALHGDDVADELARDVELEVQRDPGRDPFALER